MTISIFRFQKTYREAGGWKPDWARYCKWLKARKIREQTRMAEATKIRERREHNDKVLRQHGLGKYQRKGDY